MIFSQSKNHVSKGTIVLNKKGMSQLTVNSNFFYPQKCTFSYTMYILYTTYVDTRHELKVYAVHSDHPSTKN